MKKADKGVLLLVTALLMAAAWTSLQATTMPEIGMRVWLKADSIVGLNDGDAVSSWPDSSGNGWHATNSIVANRPKYFINSINGLPVVRFDGVNDYLARENYTPGTHDGTFVIVTRRNGNPTVYHNILLQGPTSWTQAGSYFWQIWGDATHILMGNFASNTLDCTTTASYATGAFQIMELCKDNSGPGSTAFYIDGTLQSSGTGTQNLVSRYYLGGWNNRYMNGDIAEVLIYNTALGLSDRQLAEGILAWKYDLTNSLPVGHPWKNINPQGANLPLIYNGVPTNITPVSATLTGYLFSTGGLPTTVSVYWGPADGGAPTSGLWAYTNTFATGQWADGSYPSTNVMLPVSNLFYFYRYYAANASDATWAALSSSFIGGDLWVEAPAALASEKGTNGLFVIHRPAGATNLPTTVNFTMSGTASNGQDYLLSPRSTNAITLPANVASAAIAVLVLGDRQAEPAESVVLTLTPGLYGAGTPAGSNTVTIDASSDASSPTIAYWRFEGPFGASDNTTGFLCDSSGSGHHLLPDAGLLNSANQVLLPYLDGTNPVTYRGAAFPNPVPQTRVASTNCFWSPFAGWMAAPDSDNWTADAFTVELFLNPNYLVAHRAAGIVGQWSTSGNQRSWLLCRPASTNTLGLLLSSTGGNTYTFNGSAPDWSLNTLNDYYIAFSFDRSKTNGGVVLYMKNLTATGALLKASFDHALSGGLFNSSASLIIDGLNGAGGGTADSEGIRGLIDEIRITAGVLRERDLLINKANPGSLILVR